MSGPTHDQRLPAKNFANGRRLSLRAITMLVVIAFVVTAVGLTLAAYSGIQSRNRSLETVVEQTATLKLYEDVRSSGFAESAAAASYLSVPQQEFLDSFAESATAVEFSIAALRAQGPQRDTQQIDELAQAHEDLSGAYAAILALLQNGEDEAALQLAEQSDLAAKSERLWGALDVAIIGARTAATTAQRDHAAVQKTLDRLVLTSVAIWTLVLAVAGIAVYQWVIRPIRRVANAARRIAEGEVDSRSPVSGSREVAVLAQDMNSMADALIERSEELNAYLSKNLEARTDELAEANVTLEQSEQRFRSLVQNAPDLITVVDVDERVLYQSPSIRRVLGYEADDIVGNQLSSYVHEDDLVALRAFMHELVSNPEEIGSVEVRLRHRDGSWRYLEIRGSDRRDDPVAGIVLNSRDITKHKNLEEELTFQAFHDSLTGLANRASFTDRLAHALARSRRTGTIPAVLFIDLDNFKAVNDSFGHSAGDEVLASVAKRIQSCLRAEDTTARLGGDEFAVLLEDLDTPDRARLVAERILRAQEAPFSYQGQDVYVRASIGVATADGLNDDEQSGVRTILRNADVAMYAAKRDGKAYYEVYDEVMHASVLRRLELLGDLRSAVERKEFFIQYQPLVDLRTLEVRGLEALVRWNHPQHGMISPADFIPIAEESGAIRALGLWVMEEACRQMGEWDRELPDDQKLYLSVNVSVQQILDRDFVGEVEDVLERTAFDPTRLTLEITESITMYPGEATMTALNQLKALGARLAIDDFGTGSSSYAYLQHFPFDVVKIDKSFIQHEDGAGDTLELTRKIVEMGKLLKLEVLAEGIEEEAQLEELREMGCAMGQGYLFAKPMDASDVLDHLSRSPSSKAA